MAGLLYNKSRLKLRSYMMDWTQDDLYLFNQGTYYRAYERMGAHITSEGIQFSVWAPGARSVCVAGSFNDWRPDEFYLSPVADSGIWTGIISSASAGDLYKFVITSDEGEILYKADPYAFSAEQRPGTASRISDIDGFDWNDADWIAARAHKDHFRSPLNIYEVHPGSWKRNSEYTGSGDDGHFLTYRELADQLIPYVKDMGYTHIELMPVAEHPFDGSWGYQVTGYFAPTSRYGTPKDLMYLVNRAHLEGIGIILDWVPGHFCKDAHGLGRFNGHMLYEKKEHVHWGTYIFDYGRPEVKTFLLSNAYYWLDVYHVDGIRVDGVSSMLYLNYGIDEPDQKEFNKNGGEENLEAISLLQEFNDMTGRCFAGAFTVAEESSAWPLVTYPPSDGGLGFHYKWNMGWMNDTLRYFSEDFRWRCDHHDLLTFSMMYAFSENFILPLSHDEVVHGKRSLIGRMPGTYEEQFAGLKSLALYQMCHTGAKLNFMGNEIGQFIEWRFAEPLEWFLLDYDQHRKHHDFIRALNHLYLDESPLWKDNSSWDGFHWIDVNNNTQSVLSFYRTDPETGEHLICIINFSLTDFGEYDTGVPEYGIYREIISTDDERFGGQGRTNSSELRAHDNAMHGFEQRITLRLAPLTGVILKCTRKLHHPQKKNRINSKDK